MVLLVGQATPNISKIPSGGNLETLPGLSFWTRDGFVVFLGNHQVVKYLGKVHRRESARKFEALEYEGGVRLGHLLLLHPFDRVCQGVKLFPFQVLPCPPN